MDIDEPNSLSSSLSSLTFLSSEFNQFKSVNLVKLDWTLYD